jgi:ribosomal protein L15
VKKRNYVQLHNAFIDNYIDLLILFFSHPGYFGKVGMRYFHKTNNKFYCPTMNVDKIWSLVTEQTREKYAKEPSKAPVIDCVRAVSLISFTIYVGIPEHVGASMAE